MAIRRGSREDGWRSAEGRKPKFSRPRFRRFSRRGIREEEFVEEEFVEEEFVERNSWRGIRGGEFVEEEEIVEGPKFPDSDSEGLREVDARTIRESPGCSTVGVSRVFRNIFDSSKQVQINGMSVPQLSPSVPAKIESSCAPVPCHRLTLDLAAIKNPAILLDRLSELPDCNPVALVREERPLGLNYISYTPRATGCFFIKGIFNLIRDAPYGFLRDDTIRIRVHDATRFYKTIEERFNSFRSCFSTAGVNIRRYPLDAYGNITFNLSTTKMASEDSSWRVSTLDKTRIQVNETGVAVSFNQLYQYIGHCIGVDFRFRFAYEETVIFVALEAYSIDVY